MEICEANVISIASYRRVTDCYKHLRDINDEDSTQDSLLQFCEESAASPISSIRSHTSVPSLSNVSAVRATEIPLQV